MSGDDLTKEQLENLKSGIGPMLTYLGKLRSRMEKKFPGNDPLLLKVRKAWEEVYTLSIDLHYRSCKGGVGR